MVGEWVGGLRVRWEYTQMQEGAGRGEGELLEGHMHVKVHRHGGMRPPEWTQHPMGPTNQQGRRLPKRLGRTAPQPPTQPTQQANTHAPPTFAPHRKLPASPTLTPATQEPSHRTTCAPTCLEDEGVLEEGVGDGVGQDVHHRQQEAP